MKRLLLLCLFWMAVGAFAQTSDDATVSDTLLGHLETLEENVVALRGLDALVPVDRFFPSREEAIAFFTETYNEEMTEDVLYEETLFYRAFDFIEPGFDLLAFVIALSADQVAGYYDPETDAMNVLLISGQPLGDSLPAIDRMTYAHEYTHALQDQHFDLLSLLEIEETDVALAVRALVEGDASLAMQNYMIDLIQREPVLMLQLSAALFTIDADLPAGTPPTLGDELTMPYVDGLNFVTTLYNNGGWDAVNAAFTALPRSTEQILHPQRYLDGDIPQTITIETPDLGDGWTFVLERTLGEFYLREYLETRLGGSTAAAAAEGWGGDRAAIYHQPETDSIAWVMRLAWDSPEEAEQFQTAFATFAELADQNTDGPACQKTAAATLCFSGGDTFIIASAPDAQIAQSLILAQS